MNVLKKLTSCLAAGLLFTSLHAQSIGPSIINATGGTAIIGANEFDWSVGEMTMVSTFTAANIVVTQGLLQPANTTTGVVAHALPDRQISVFPNPASSELNVQYTAATAGTMTCRVMGMAGKVVVEQLMNVKPGTNTRQINITELAADTYLLEVTVGQGNASTDAASFKIQKLK